MTFMWHCNPCKNKSIRQTTSFQSLEIVQSVKQLIIQPGKDGDNCTKDSYNYIQGKLISVPLIVRCLNAY